MKKKTTTEVHSYSFVSIFTSIHLRKEKVWASFSAEEELFNKQLYEAIFSLEWFPAKFIFSTRRRDLIGLYYTDEY